jgi:hypothetical protein
MSRFPNSTLRPYRTDEEVTENRYGDHYLEAELHSVEKELISSWNPCSGLPPQSTIWLTARTSNYKNT